MLDHWRRELEIVEGEEKLEDFGLMIARVS